METGLPKRAQCGRVKAKLGQKTESVSSGGSRNDALHVTTLYGLGDNISFFLQIGSWQRWH